MVTKAAKPPSAQSFGLNMVGVACICIALYALREQHLDGLNGVLILCAAGVVPIILFDIFALRVHRRPSTGLDWDRAPTSDLKRVATKLLGLGLTVGLIALAYWSFPEYRFMGNTNDFYRPFYSVLRQFWAPLVVSAIVYVWIVDGYMRDPYDAYWQLGRVVLFHPSDAKKADMANHFRGWLVKAFYIPLFIVYGQNQLNGLLHFNLDTIQASNVRLYQFLNDLVYGLDVLFAMVGYLLSFRVIDSHVRTAEPTMLGWCVALECYDPFWRGMFQRQYLHYEGIGFETWLQDHHTIRWCWVAAILSCDLVYVLATFAFGVRFSNLTHRGILTNGPYRFSKHPAYIAKNLSWWLITLPCIPIGVLGAHSITEAIRNSLLLGGVNMIYFMRAKTEERHLSRDPTYVEYALWMNDHGVLSFLGRWFPILKYKAPASYKPASPSQKPPPTATATTTPATEAGGA